MPEDKAKRDRRMKAYNATPEEKRKRALRNKARREALREGKVRKGDEREIDHKKPLSKGGSGAKSNTRVVSRAKNRAHGMSRGGGRRKGS